MEKEFVPYEQALELKELGFNEPCLGYWNIDPYLPKPTLNMVRPFDHEWCVPAPLYQQAFKFFREKYGCSHNITKTIGGEYIPYVNGYELNLDDNCEEVVGFKWIYKTYEEAELACLKKLIEITKTK